MDYEAVELEPNRNAEAYRNYQPTAVPTQTDKFLDFIQFSSDGHLLLGCSNLTGRYWSGSLWYFLDADAAPDVEKCLTGVECETGVCDGKFLKDEQRVIVGEDSGSVQILALTEAADEHIFHFSPIGSSCEHDDSIVSISVFKDKPRAVSGSFDTNIKVWDVETLVAEHTYRPAHLHIVTDVAVRPNDEGSVFASCSLDGTAVLWDTRNTKPASIFLRDGRLTSLAWQPSQSEIVCVGSESGKVIFVDIRQANQKLSEVACFKRPLQRLQFDANGINHLAACSDDSLVRVLDCTDSASPSVCYTDDRHNDFVRGLAWHPKSNQLYSCGWDKQVLAHNTNIASPSFIHMEVNEI
ncbi:methylosome protein WDR77 [Anabrus simplex]|uniref:methylosome protein WDR77 n=1 Tax=Anabrus simplex TaxID=316456 RepID=UPI0035A30D4B